MREIEIKARVQDKAKTLEALTSLGVTLSTPIKQHDVVYGPAGARGNDKVSWLRVRTENDTKILFTLKKSVTGQLDSIEHEVVVDDENELTAIIKNIGFELYSDLTKIRQKAKFGDYEICLDELPSMGTFIEIEKLCADDVDIEEISNELWHIFEQLGISQEDQETDGYDVMERKARGLEE